MDNHQQSLTANRDTERNPSPKVAAETVRGLAQTAELLKYITETDARSLTAAVRCTPRGTPHTHTRAEPDSTERGSMEH
ncbi:hypothetical protein EVAR_101187_1 [Eumeta japonica]|uniref:Uncharacterized protein n=1 Tax=Eumeta variegata TaxID=151549 RepID=A0A4C1S9F1_EUMVA|nr:hypothetical protein EVAR_101187_1 [Eumeta japonica]